MILRNNRRLKKIKKGGAIMRKKNSNLNKTNRSFCAAHNHNIILLIK